MAGSNPASARFLFSDFKGALHFTGDSLFCADAHIALLLNSRCSIPVTPYLTLPSSLRSVRSTIDANGFPGHVARLVGSKKRN